MLETIAAQDAPDTVKVFNLLKAISQLAESSAGKEPYLISSLSRTANGLKPTIDYLRQAPGERGVGSDQPSVTSYPQPSP